MKVEIEEVYYIARLSRLHINENEVLNVSKKLSKILEYMSKLESLDFESNIESSIFNDSGNALRQDKLDMRLSHNDALNASLHPGRDYFRVPKVIS